MVSLVVRKLANRVGTKPGAIQLTRVLGPISPARAYKYINSLIIKYPKKLVVIFKYCVQYIVFYFSILCTSL